MAKKPIRHIVITDQQINPAHPCDQIDWIARCVIDLKPDVLVIIGDWADMPSLSSYDKNKKEFEGRTYRADILAANDALQRLMAPIEAEQARVARNRKGRWNLRKICTLGNHENRINRAISMQRELDGLISIDDLFFKQWGFEVYDFLTPAIADDIAYCHYFVSGDLGKPCATASAILSKHHMSCFAGHLPGKNIAYGKRADGVPLTCIIAGSGYLHDEGYRNAQTNNVWKGIFALNDVRRGAFDEMPLSLSYLERKYGQVRTSPQPQLQRVEGSAVPASDELGRAGRS